MKREKREVNIIRSSAADILHSSLLPEKAM